MSICKHSSAMWGEGIRHYLPITFYHIKQKRSVINQCIPEIRKLCWLYYNDQWQAVYRLGNFLIHSASPKDPDTKYHLYEAIFFLASTPITQLTKFVLLADLFTYILTPISPLTELLVDLYNALFQDPPRVNEIKVLRTSFSFKYVDIRYSSTSWY